MNISVEEAQIQILKHTRCLSEEKLTLLESGGRVCAVDVFADADLPPYAQSAVDGYAVAENRADDKETFELIGRLQTGEHPMNPLQIGQTMGVLTGGNLPNGTRAVVPHEKIAMEGNQVKPLEEIKTGNNIKQAGEDFAAGEQLVARSSILSPAHISLLAAFGRDNISVFRQPRVDLRSVFAVTQAMVPLLKEDGGGSIINISSILGVLGSANSTAYCAMKGGVVQLTRAMAAELGPEIRVNCICPSHIVTAMMQGEIDRLQAAGKMDRLNRLFPMKRVGYPDDMNGTILFFASPDSAWLTGNIFMVDGGLSCYV